ncbi:PilZ domain-containing protein [Sphingomonas adhaesiva]|uniref:PilZ domain-containing protein n=1 Tax=Sphingomonas adhaesiva TaxID=28212 RepID=UPI002FF99FED
MRPAIAVFEERVEPRDETLFRTKLRLDDGSAYPATIVNVSPHGLMARCDAVVAVGDLVAVTLPVVGDFSAEVRWTLGGRIGCRLTREVPPALYQFAVAAMR